jgi:hypothetical protein
MLSIDRGRRAEEAESAGFPACCVAFSIHVKEEEHRRHLFGDSDRGEETGCVCDTAKDRLKRQRAGEVVHGLLHLPEASMRGCGWIVESGGLMYPGCGSDMVEGRRRLSTCSLETHRL